MEGESWSCPVCLRSNGPTVEIFCSHVICKYCLKQCAEKDISRCPLCRKEQLLDPDKLFLRFKNARLKYRSWRQGGPGPPLIDPSSSSSLTILGLGQQPRLLCCPSIGLIC